MQVENLQLVTVLLIVLGILVVLQALLLWVTMSQLNQLLQRLNRLVDPASSWAVAVLTGFEQLLDRMEAFRERIPAWVERSQSSLTHLRRLAERADEAAGRGLEQARKQTQAADQLLDGLLTRFSQQTYQVHRALVSPAIRVSALVKATKVTLGRFFSRRSDGSPARYHPDQEIFI